MEAKKRTIEKQKLLLVEGADEVKFFNCLLKHLNKDDIQVFDTNGKNNLKAELPLIKNMPNFSKVETIAIVRDADNSTADAFKSVSQILNNNHITPPDGVNMVSKKGNYTVGVFIMPGNQGHGMLETLVMDSLKDCNVRQHADTYIETLLINVGKDNAPKNVHKAKMHAYLAGKREYVPNLGVATEKGFFDLASPAFENIRHFVTQL